MQFELPRHRQLLKVSAAQADVIHSHLIYQTDRGGKGGYRPFYVMHHHGTMYREAPDARNAQDAAFADLVLVSNLELLKYGSHLHYLPNPISVTQYRRYADANPPEDDGKFYVGHSPSKRDIKGTEEFLAACANLKQKGLPIEPLLIEEVQHNKAVKYKARCHAFFDSFWLGIQCSGLEAAAMGKPVIAGDEEIESLWNYHFGDCPYIFANNQARLEEFIARLYEDQVYYNLSRYKCFDHVLQYHDYAAVALRYLELLDEHMGWRVKLMKKGKGP